METRKNQSIFEELLQNEWLRRIDKRQEITSNFLDDDYMTGYKDCVSDVLKIIDELKENENV